MIISIGSLKKALTILVVFMNTRSLHFSELVFLNDLTKVLSAVVYKIELQCRTGSVSCSYE